MGRRTCSLPLLAALVLLAELAMAETSLPNPLLFNFRPREASKGERPGYLKEAGSYFKRRKLNLKYGFVNRRGAPRFYLGNTRVRSGPGTLEERTFYRFTGRGEYWKVQLPPGQYKVVMFCGDSSKIQNSQTFIVNGRYTLYNAKRNSKSPSVEWEGEVTTTKRGNIFISGLAGSKLQYVQIFQQSGCRPNPSKFNGKFISNLPCNVVRVEVPYNAKFTSSRIVSITDSRGLSTGFTMVVPSSKETSYYRPELIRVEEETLKVRPASRGTWAGKSNDVVNALGVGIPQPDTDIQVKVSMTVPRSDSRIMGCLYTAISDSTYVTLCVTSLNSGRHQLEARYELDDGTAKFVKKPVALSKSRSITLLMKLEPLNNRVNLHFKTGEQPPTLLTMVSAAPSMFSKDAAQHDFQVSTGTFSGVWFSGPDDIEYTVNSFEALPIADSGKEELGDEDFEVDWTIGGMTFPTALTVCDDGKLYVASASGTVTKVTLDRALRKTIKKATYRPVGDRMILGITCDPDSSHEDVALWLSHTDRRQAGAAANSGTISKVYGKGFKRRTDKVTGLPRSAANHANNQIHFGPDGYLYCGVGSNTAAGAPNYLPTDFSRRPEQYFSAAMLRMNIRSDSFRGDCAPSQPPSDLDKSGSAEKVKPSNCDVELYATGLRSPYDFIFIGNQLVATDNGNGDDATFPLLDDNYRRTGYCDGVVSRKQYKEAVCSKRDDVLVYVNKGKYYGHPNPARRECVFQGGNMGRGTDYPVKRSSLFGGGFFNMDQVRYSRGTKPEPNFEKARFAFGESVSPNGILQYKGKAFCGGLYDALLVTYYSQMDRVQVLKLDKTKQFVEKDHPLRRSTEQSGGKAMKNPLALAQDRTGLIFVAEFFGGRIRIFDPIGPNCWVDSSNEPAPMPFARAQAGFVQQLDDLYMYGGVGRRGYAYSLFKYNVIRDKWTVFPTFRDRSPVRKPCVAYRSGRVYMYGGYQQTGRPSKRVLMYDIKSQKYYQFNRRPMPAPVGGAVGIIRYSFAYAIGGQGYSGRPSKEVWTLYLVDKSVPWYRVASMNVARKDAMGVLLPNLKIMVCGGVNDRFKVESSCEIYDRDTNKWTMTRPMPVSRFGGGIVSVTRKKVIVMGGQGPQRVNRTSVYEYNRDTDKWKKLNNMPSHKSYAAYARFGTSTHVFGGRSGGSQYSKDGQIHNYL